jgi:tetratricopeptide (TPR) repeat protein
MQSIIKKIVWTCLILVPFVALHVADGGFFDVLSWGGTQGLFFPFISGKNLIFRTLVEVAFAGWVILALKDAAYRINIKKSPIMIAYGLFIGILFLADVFGVDVQKSMWSNFERMEGFVAHLHFFMYFFVLTVMLPTVKEWQSMFKAFIVSDILVLMYGYGQLLGAKGLFFADHFPTVATWFSSRFPIHMSSNRLDATIGNSAYFAIFCLMFVFIAALLWAQSKEPKKQWLYPTLIVLNLIALFYSGTRGTMIGALVGGFAALGIMAFHEKGKPRKVLVGAIIAATVVIVSIFAFKNTTFIQSSPTLSRLASISPTDITTASRFNIWKISFQAWTEKPVLGYGQDNFSYVFARKFMADKMWNLEPWYDRSHNVFFDWLIAAGILGLLSYLSLYGVTLWFMWRKGNDMPFYEKVIITGALIGYFVHNIFVFDNLTSYIVFFALLAYVTVRTKGHNTSSHGKPLVDEEQMTLLIAPAVGLLLLVTLYYVNYRPMLVNQLVIKGMSISRYAKDMPFAEALKVQRDAFTSAITMNTLGSEEAREQFLQMAVQISQIKIPQDAPAGERQATVQAINETLKAVRDDITTSLPSHKEDVRMLSIYGMFYNGVGDAASAEQVLTLARTYAPNKQLLSLDLIRSYLLQRKYAEAYALAREVYDSAPLYVEGQKWYMVSAAYAGAFKDAKAYITSKGKVVAFDPDVVSVLVTTGQVPLALEILQDLKKTNPEYATQVDEYIKQILAPVKK